MADFTDAQLLKIANNPETTDDDIKALGKDQIARIQKLTAAKPTDSDGVATFAAGQALPLVAHGVEAFATSPTMPKTVGAIARGLTTAAGTLKGAYDVATGNPANGLAQIVAAPMEGWAAGRGGYFLGNGMQSVARPVAGALASVAPYAKALSTAGGAMGMLDLAQMADPTRRDIGPVSLSDKGDPAHPALINAAVSKAVQILKRYAPGSLASAMLLLFAISASAQTYTITPTPFQTAFDNNGIIISGACVWTYTAGTSTAATTYSDNLGTQNTNPIKADSAGRFTAFLVQGLSYKFQYESSCTAPVHGTILRTADNISAVPSSATNVDISGTAGQTLTVGQSVYLSDGSGAKVAGEWYPTDPSANYSSVTNALGFVTIGGTAGGPVTVRRAGQVMNLSSLTPGLLYYATTTGAIASAVPIINPVVVGQADTTTSLVIPAPTAVSPDFVCGRLTLTAGTPTTVNDVTAATSLFYAPDGCNQISLWQSGSFWSVRTFAQLSIAVPATVSQMYDIFVYDNSGQPTLELLAWASDTVRATSLGRQDGRLVKGTDATRRYVGSFRTTTVSGQTEDSTTKRYLWNNYHRVKRQLLKFAADASWSYTTATVRQWNGNTANQVDAIVGFQDALVDLRLQISASTTAAVASATPIAVCFGIDSTTTCNTSNTGGVTYVFGDPTDTTAGGGNPTAFLSVYPIVGRHLFQALEWSTASGTTTWHGTNAGPTNTSAGIMGWIDG